jgi:hypothetical protein
MVGRQRKGRLDLAGLDSFIVFCHGLVPAIGVLLRRQQVMRTLCICWAHDDIMVVWTLGIVGEGRDGVCVHLFIVLMGVCWLVV